MMNPKFSGWRSYTLVELPILLFSFSQIYAGSLKSIQIWELCDGSKQLPANASIMDETHATFDCTENIFMYKNFVDLLVPALLTFFLGPWSDSHGRKPLLVAAYAGSAMSSLLWFVLSSLGPLNPLIFLVASVPATLVGGYCTIILVTCSYITDIRQESDRGWHFTWLQSVISIGHVLGYIACKANPNIHHYATNSAVAAIANAIATIYVLFFVPESVRRRDAKRPWFSLFDPSSIKGMFTSCVRKRDSFDRILIWSCVCALTINVLIREGELFFLFRSMYLRYSSQYIFWYLLTVMLLIIAGTILGGLICRALIDRTMANMSIVLLANYSGFIGSIAKAFSIQLWHLYLSNFLGILGVLSEPVIRNALSKSAPPQEVGKVFSLMASMEAIITVVAKQLYFMAHRHDEQPATYPSPMYLLSAGLYACTILIAVAIKLRISKLLVLNRPPNTAIELQIH